VTSSPAGRSGIPRACLHWGWKRGDTYLDPLLLVGGGPIVLLPLWQETPVGPVTAPSAPYAVIVARLLARSALARPSRVIAPRVVSPVSVWHRPLAMRPLLP